MVDRKVRDTSVANEKSVKTPDKKMFFNLVVRGLNLSYRLPDVSGMKREWPLWGGGFSIISATF